MSQAAPLHDLTARELQALRGAAVWYAKYHATAVAGHADGRTAESIAERDEYLDLISALRKLGVRIRVPDGLSRQAADAA